jgi:hypothetical protein
VSYRPGINTRIRLSLAIVIVTAAGVWTPAAAQEQAQQREHIVKRGDTLWGLARLYLNNPFLWPSIFDANRGVVEDPHWIYPDERLLIPFLQMIGVQPVTESTDPPLTFGPGSAPDTRTRFYRPGPAMDSARTGLSFQAAQAVEPYAVTASEYQSAPWLGSRAELTEIGVIHGVTDPATSDERLSAALKPFERIYITRLATRPSVGDTVLAVRVGPDVGGLGEVIQPLALIRVDEVASEAVVGAVVRQFAPARAGDLVVVADPTPAMTRGRAQEVTDGAQGRIANFLHQQALYIASDRGFLDIGAADGLSVGDEVVAFYPERRYDRDGPLMPAEPVASRGVV